MKASRKDFIKRLILTQIITMLPVRWAFPREKENKWRNGTIKRFAGTGAPGNNGDHGLAALAQLNGPAGLAIDINDNVYVAEIGNSKIRRIDTKTNIITTIAGNGQAGFSGDGDLATNAALNRPEGVFIDREENVYIADSGNQRIRKVTKKTGIINTIAGTGEAGFNFNEGNALEARLNHPSGIVVDSGCNIYFNDYSNELIRKISTNGKISTYAGNGSSGYSGDGNEADKAQINDVYGLAIDKFDNIYFVDSLNFCVRKIDRATSLISTVIGKGEPGEVKEFVTKENAFLGGVAHKKGTIGSKVAHGLDIDNSGNIFIADTGVNRLRMYNKNEDSFYTIAGTGSPGTAEDFNKAIESNIDIHGVRVDSMGRIYFLDYIHHLVYFLNFASD